MPALFIVLDRAVPDCGPDAVDGTALCRALHLLDKDARAIGVPPLGEFISALPADLDEPELTADGDGERWYPPEVGLKTVRALRTRHAHEDDDALAEDLASLEQVLRGAQETGARFHLALDS